MNARVVNMDFSLSSFISGVLGGGVLLVYIQHRFPRLLPNIREEKLLSQIEVLEERLEKKDLLICKAIKATEKGNCNESE